MTRSIDVLSTKRCLAAMPLRCSTWNMLRLQCQPASLFMLAFVILLSSCTPGGLENGSDSQTQATPQRPRDPETDQIVRGVCWATEIPMGKAMPAHTPGQNPGQWFRNYKINAHIDFKRQSASVDSLSVWTLPADEEARRRMGDLVMAPAIFRADADAEERARKTDAKAAPCTFTPARSDSPQPAGLIAMRQSFARRFSNLIGQGQIEKDMVLTDGCSGKDLKFQIRLKLKKGDMRETWSALSELSPERNSASPEAVSKSGSDARFERFDSSARQWPELRLEVLDGERLEGKPVWIPVAQCPFYLDHQGDTQINRLSRFVRPEKSSKVLSGPFATSLIGNGLATGIHFSSKTLEALHTQQQRAVSGRLTELAQESDIKDLLDAFRTYLKTGQLDEPIVTPEGWNRIESSDPNEPIQFFSIAPPNYHTPLYLAISQLSRSKIDIRYTCAGGKMTNCPKSRVTQLTSGCRHGINAGYFDSNGQSMSLVVKDRLIVGRDVQRFRALGGSAQPTRAALFLGDRKAALHWASAVGDSVQIFGSPADPLRGLREGGIPLPEEFKQGVGAGPMLVVDGAAAVYPETEAFGHESGIGPGSRQPRSAVGVTKNGHLLTLTADGRASGRPGTTLSELAQVMLNLGAQRAMHLDSGGSATFVKDGRVLNRPSDGSERPVVSALCVNP